MVDKIKAPGVSPRTYRANYTELSANTPDYYKRLKNKEILNHATYLFTGYEAKGNVVPIPGSPSSYAVLDNNENYFNVGTFLQGGFCGASKVSYNAIDRLRTNVLNALSSKVREADIQTPVALAEAKKTCQGIGAIARDIAASFRALTRGQPTEAINILVYGNQGGYHTNSISKALAGRWLEWSYGVKPLVQDARGLALACAKAQTHEQNRLVETKVTLSDYVSDSRSSPSFPTPGSNFVRSSVTASLKGVGTIHSKMAPLSNATLESFGFTDFAANAWELVPYSFVVDWFLPVGNWLSGFKPVTGLNFVDGSVYVKCNRALITQTSGVKGQYESTGSSRSTYKRRFKASGFPSYSLQVPDWDLSLGQLTNGIALLVQGISGNRYYR